MRKDNMRPIPTTSSTTRQGSTSPAVILMHNNNSDDDSSTYVDVSIPNIKNNNNNSVSMNDGSSSLDAINQEVCTMKEDDSYSKKE